MDKVEQFLLRIGIPPSNKGFGELANAVRLYQSGERVFTGNDGIYAKAASSDKWTRAERNMRTCVQAAYNRVPDLEGRLGCPCDCNRGSLTLKDFIAAVALRTKEE